jgi:uncharacterized membrane protein
MGIRIITKNGEKPFRLCLPRVLIYLFLILILILLIIPIVIVMVGLLIWNLILGQSKMVYAYTRIFFSIPKVFCALRGLTVDIESKDAIVKIKF